MAQSRGRGRGNNPIPQKVDLVPTLPPLYPPCNTPAPLTPTLSKLVPKYNEMVQHMMSNFSVKPVSSYQAPAGFTVERYSDRYCAPLQLDKILSYSIDQRRLPAELGPQKGKRTGKVSQKVLELKAKRALEKLAAMPDEEEEKEEEEDEDPVAKKIKTEPLDTDEDDVENPNPDEEEEETDTDDDKELDKGTDYLTNTFDNGEGYGDSDDDLEDSPVY